jgi:hypothetical protein
MARLRASAPDVIAVPVALLGNDQRAKEAAWHAAVEAGADRVVLWRWLHIARRQYRGLPPRDYPRLSRAERAEAARYVLTGGEQ